MAFSKEVLDEILRDYHGPEDFYGPQGIMKQLTKALAGRTMEAELTGHLGYKKHDQGEKTNTNRRNGKTTKELRTNDGPMSILAIAKAMTASQKESTGNPLKKFRSLSR